MSTQLVGHEQGEWKQAPSLQFTFIGIHDPMPVQLCQVARLDLLAWRAVLMEYQWLSGLG